MIITFKKVQNPYDVHYEVKAIIDGVTGISSFGPMIYEKYPEVLDHSIKHAAYNSIGRLINMVPIGRREFFDSIPVGKEKAYCSVNTVPELMPSSDMVPIRIFLKMGDTIFVDGNPYTIVPRTGLK